MKGIYAAVAIGEARTFTTKEGAVRVETPCAIDGEAVSVPGNGVGLYEPLFVLGDLRRFEGRNYFKGDVRVVKRDPGIELSDVLPA